MSYLPSQIGKYRIERELGRGAMGVVYQAFDLVIERPVALKTIYASVAEGAELVEVLRREAKSVGRFEHPNIVTLFDAADIDGSFCMVMQLIHGQSLRDRLHGQRWFTVAEIIDIFRQILAGLGYAHERGIIHRDIKPANIMINVEGVVKLADFGIAKLISPHVSSSGLVVGTPSYMSPEQVLGRPVDARSDIFSVGCVLYEILTGEKAYPGDSASSIMYRIVHESPTRPAKMRPGTDSGLEAITLKALANNPADRYADCRDMAEALVSCLNRQAAARKTFANSIGPVLHEATPSARSDAHQMRRRWINIVVTATSTGVAISLIATLVARKPGSDPVPPPPGPPRTEQTVAPENTHSSLPIELVRKVEKPLSSSFSKGVHRPARIYPRTMRSVQIPDTFTAMILRGDEAFQQGDYERALSAYLRAQALKPGDPGLRRKLKVVLTQLGRGADAEKNE